MTNIDDPVERLRAVLLLAALEASLDGQDRYVMTDADGPFIELVPCGEQWVRVTPDSYAHPSTGGKPVKLVRE